MSEKETGRSVFLVKPMEVATSEREANRRKTLVDLTIEDPTRVRAACMFHFGLVLELAELVLIASGVLVLAIGLAFVTVFVCVR